MVSKQKKTARRVKKRKACHLDFVLHVIHLPQRVFKAKTLTGTICFKGKNFFWGRKVHCKGNRKPPFSSYCHQNRKQVVGCRKMATRNGRWRERESKKPVHLLQIWAHQTCLYALNPICMDCTMRKSINLEIRRGLGWCLSISVFRVFNKNERKIKNRKVPQTTVSLKISSGVCTLWCHYIQAFLGKVNYQSWQKMVW